MPFTRSTFIKKAFKIIGYAILSFVALVLVYLLAAYCLARITVNKERYAGNEVTIYIKTNGVHTDLVVPVKNAQMDWTSEVKYANTAANDTSMQWLAMGWGDKGFYLETPQWSDLTFRVATKAAFALGSTAIHATFYRSMPENESCMRIVIGKEQYERLMRYIFDSFDKDASGHPIKINTTANYSTTDAFYEAKGSYSLFRTCNTWANSGLKSCGQKACLWTPFDTGIFLKYP